MTTRTVVLHNEGVPNPNAMKIVLENGVMTDEPYEFTSWTEAEDAPLARKLLMLRYVDRVMLNVNYVTIVKKANTPHWDELLPELRRMVRTHLEENEPIIYVGAEKLKHQKTDDMVVKMVNQLLDKKIRPAAQVDGGDIVFESYENGVLNLSMHGACSGCPYAINTLKQGVEPLLSQMVPEIKSVVAKDNNVPM
ncbi:MAG: NifU family protein [Bacteroidota bacterium]